MVSVIFIHTHTIPTYITNKNTTSALSGLYSRSSGNEGAGSGGSGGTDTGTRGGGRSGGSGLPGSLKDLEVHEGRAKSTVWVQRWKCRSL